MSQIFAIIYGCLIVEIIYLLICGVCYIYHNPQYRVFWAAFYRNPPQLDSSERPSEETTTHSSSSISQSPKGQTKTKHTSFIRYGLETLSHCILMQLCLIGVLVTICIRLRITYITNRSIWSQHNVFCSYAYNLQSGGLAAHYCLLIVLCIPALKIHYTYDTIHTNKCQRMLPVASIVFMLLSIPVSMFQMVLQHFVVTQYEGVALCINIGGIGLNPYFKAYCTFQYHFSSILCVMTVTVPIFVQRKMLINLPKNKQNEELVTLITKVNGLYKRICISALVIIITYIIISVFYWSFASHPDPKIKQFLSIALSSFDVQSYLGIPFIYNDWIIRLFPFCSYGHINCHCQTKQKCVDVNDGMNIELVSSERTSSLALPQLVRDVSKDDAKEDTHTFTR
eukprot:372025_1